MQFIIIHKYLFRLIIIIIIIIFQSVILAVYWQDITHKFVRNIMALKFLPAQHINRCLNWTTTSANRVFSLLMDSAQQQSISGLIGRGHFGMVPFSLLLVPDYLYGIHAAFSISLSDNPFWYYYFFIVETLNYTYIISRIV